MHRIPTIVLSLVCFNLKCRFFDYYSTNFISLCIQLYVFNYKIVPKNQNFHNLVGYFCGLSQQDLYRCVSISCISHKGRFYAYTYIRRALETYSQHMRIRILYSNSFYAIIEKPKSSQFGVRIFAGMKTGPPQQESFRHSYVAKWISKYLVYSFRVLQL